MDPNGRGLGAAKLACKVRREERNRLFMGQLTLTFGRYELLLESQAGSIQQRLDCALRHLEGPGDLAVAEILELAKSQHEPVLLRQALSDRPDLPAHLVRFLDLKR